MAALARASQRLSVALGLDDLLAAIIAAGADVMAQVHFATDGFDRERRVGQKIMPAPHAALRWRLFILLYSHFVSLLKGSVCPLLQGGEPRERGGLDCRLLCRRCRVVPKTLGTAPFGMARRERQRKQYLVFDERQRIERCRRKHHFRVALV